MPLKCSKGEEGRNHLVEVKFQHKPPGCFTKTQRRNERSEFSMENSQSREGYRIQGSCKEDKRWMNPPFGS
jgi:hypothetical protein